jgi:hypothetical protein
VILASSKEKKVLTEVNMGAPIYSTPIVAERHNVYRHPDASVRNR